MIEKETHAEKLSGKVSKYLDAKNNAQEYNFQPGQLMHVRFIDNHEDIQ